MPSTDHLSSTTETTPETTPEGGEPAGAVTTTQLPIPQRVRILASRRRQPPIQGVLAAAALNFSVGAIYAWSVFIAPISSDLGISTGTLTMAFSAALLAFAGAVTVGGAAAQREPRLAARWSAAGTLVSMAATGLAPNAPALIAALVAVGAAGGIAYAAATGVAAGALPRHRGLSLGFVVASGAAGPIAIGPLASALMAGFGWRVAFAALGAIIATAMVGTSRWLRADIAQGHAVDPRAGEPHDLPDRRLVVVTLWVLFFLGSLTGLAVFGHAAQIATAAGASAALGGLAVAGVSTGDVLARVASSTIDEGWRVIALATALGVLALGAVTLTVAPGPLTTLVALVVTGAGYGATAGLIPSVASDHIRRDRFSEVFGRIFTAWGVAAVIGPLGTAWLLRRTGSYDVAFIIGATASAVALATVLVLRRKLRRRANERFHHGAATSYDHRMLGMRLAAPATASPETETDAATDAGEDR